MDSPPSTPATSIEPKSETPASADGMAETLSYEDRIARRTAFQKLQSNERSAVDKLLNYFIQNDRKAGLTAGEDRFQMLRKKRQEKLDERIGQGKGSIETVFPKLYNQATEERWLRQKFSIYLDGNGRGGMAEDQDDEEDVPVRQRQRGGKIKSEGMENLDGSGLDTSRGRQGKMSRPAKKIEEAEEPMDDEDEKPSKPVVGVPCPRSYAIRFGCAGLKELKAIIKAENSKSKSSVVVGVAVTPGFVRSVKGGMTALKRKSEEDNDEEKTVGKAKKAKL